MTFQRLFLYSCILVVTAGCAPKTRYAWNEYDDKLYQHYKNPADYDQFVEQLKEIIEEAEAANKVPPGIYAEYGFALYEKANYPEAIKYFKLENDKWPESRVLMAKMIRVAQQRSNQGKQPNQAVLPINPEPAKTTISDAKGASK
jgi:hypothetical protein